MRPSHYVTAVLVMLVAVASGCLVDLNAYGLRVNVAAEGEPLTRGEVAELREIARETAKKEHLSELEDFKGEGPGDEVYDFYTVLEGPSRNIRLFVAKNRRHAHVQIDDWHSAGDVNEWIRTVTDRVVKELETRLPTRSVEVEVRDMGFWRP